MKIYRWIRIVILFFGMAAVGAFVVLLIYSPTHHLDSEPPRAVSPATTNTSARKMDITTNTASNAPNQQIELFRVIMDVQSGQYAAVNSERELVMLKNKNGNIIWSTNIVQALGMTPISGDRKINAMRLINNKLEVIVGMHTYFYINKESGDVTYFGSD